MIVEGDVASASEPSEPDIDMGDASQIKKSRSKSPQSRYVLKKVKDPKEKRTKHKTLPATIASSKLDKRS